MAFPLRTILFALAYWAGVEMVYATPGNFADFWLPSGIYLAVLLRTPPRRWWAFCVTAGVVNFTADVIVHGQSVSLGAGYALLNAGLPLAGAILLERWCRPAFSFARLPHVLLWGLVISFISSLLSALGGAALKVTLRGGDFWQDWFLWWIGNLLGTLVAMPLTLGILDWQAERKAFRGREGAVLFLSAGLAGWLLFRQPDPVVIPPAVLYLFLMWAALRLGATGVAATSLLLVVISLWLTAAGLGPYSPFPTMQLRMLTVQLLIAVGAFLFYILAAVTAERRAAESDLQQSNVKLDEQVKKRTAELASANEELRASETSLQMAMETANIFAWEIDVPSGQSLWSDNAPRALGFPPDAMPRTVPEAMSFNHADDATRVQSVMEKVLAGQQHSFSFEQRLINPSDQSTVWIESRGTAKNVVDGKPARIVGLAQNITARKVADEKLQRSNELFSTLAQTAPVGIFRTDADGKCIYVNEWWMQISGLSLADSLGTGWTKAVHPDDRERVWTEWSKAARNSLTFSAEYRFVDPDGKETFVIGQAVAEKAADGEILGYVGTITDITKRREAEKAQSCLAAIVESSDDAIISKDLNSIITSWNQGAEKLFGYTAAEAVGQSVTMLIPTERLDDETLILDCIRRGKVVRHYETVRRRKDGTLLDISLTVSPIRDESGTIIGASKIARDITERKQAEKQLRESRERLAATQINAPIGIVETNQVGKYLSVNDEFCRMTGYRRDELLKLTLRDLTHEEDYPRNHELFERMLAGEFPSYQLEKRFVRKDGSIVWADVHRTLFKDADGNPLYVIGAIADITTRKQAEEALRESEARYRGIFNAVTVSIWEEDFTAVIDLLNDLKAKGVTDFRAYLKAHLETVAEAAARVKVLDVNAESVRMFGAKDRQELLGSLDKIFVPETLSVFAEELAFIAEGGGYFEGDAVVQTLQGKRLEITFSINFPAPGEPFDRVLVNLLDITARKRHEANLAFLADLQTEFAPMLSAAEIMHAAGERIAAHLGLTHCLFVEMNETASTATVVHDQRAEGANNLAGVYDLADFHTADERAMLQRGEVLVIDDVRDGARSEEAAAAFKALGIGALLNAPFIGESGWKFTLSAQCSEPHEWLDDERELLQELAARIYIRIERARAEEALRSSEEFNRTVLEASPDCVKLIDTDGNLLYMNINGLCIMEIDDFEALQGKQWCEFWSEDAKPKINKAIERAREGRPTHFQEFCLTAKGTPKWWDVIVSPVAGADGKPVSLLAVSRDVTESKEAEERIRAAHDTFRHLVENSPFGIYVVDADFRLSQVGVGAQKVFENVHPLIGRDFAEVLREIWQEPFAGEAIATFRRTLETGEPYHAPSTIEQRHDIAEVEAYDWKIERITMPDGRFGVVCHFYDLSERLRYAAALRESEERFRMASDAAAALVYDVDLTGRRNVIAHGLERVTGYSKEDSDLSSNWWHSLIHPDDLPGHLDNYEKHLERGGAYRACYRIRRKDGECIWVEDTAMIIADSPDSGDVRQLVGTIVDITARVEAEKGERRRELLENLVEFQEAERHRVARDIHDHLGQQLTGLRLALADLKEISGGDPSILEKVEKTQEVALRLDNDASRLAFELRSNVLVDLGLAKALESFASEWSRNYGIRAEFHAVGTSERLASDLETHLYRIAQEALNNIVKHSRATTVGVMLKVLNGEVRLIVEDNGVGFDVDQNIPVRPPDEGHGLGLLGMKERVELLAGTLEIDSQPGQGTTLFISAPARFKETARKVSG